jgi:hypothetical protein
MSKISFDFDLTLSTRAAHIYAKKLIEAGHEVWIVTSRYEHLESYKEANFEIENLNEQYLHLFVIAEQLGIPKEHIHFTNMEFKHKFFSENSDFVWHLDDNKEEVRLINELQKPIVGVLYNWNSDWKTICNGLLE